MRETLGKAKTVRELLFSEKFDQKSFYPPGVSIVVAAVFLWMIRVENSAVSVGCWLPVI